MSDSHQVIIGLEIHVQLQTQTKLFCRCTTEFGGEPNTQTCHVCTGMPGALPVLNEKALELAIKTGLALNCKIERRTKWDRKNYFYPDLPKGYQISQFDRPICFDGYLDIVDAKGVATDRRICIERAHLEEDAGKSNHDESGRGGDSKIDLNRAGTPLLEIVTKPDLRSAAETKNFLSELKLILTYIGVSDCNMQQGNLRVDANVNVRVDVEKNICTPIVEIKNLNSFRAVERAINFEIERQVSEYKSNGATIDSVPKQTRGWNDEKQATYPQREKEDSADYRYFPDPDLTTIFIEESTIDRISADLAILPAVVRNRFCELGLSTYDSDVLVRQGREVVDFFDDVMNKVGDAKLVSNWIQQEVLRYLNDNNSHVSTYPVTADRIAELLNAVAAKEIDNNRAKDVLSLMVESRLDFDTAKQDLGIVAVNQSEIEAICKKIVSENSVAVDDYRSGNKKAIGALIGQARKLNANANPNDIRNCLISMIENV